jgi:hypothetical protein
MTPLQMIGRRVLDDLRDERLAMVGGLAVSAQVQQGAPGR